MVSVQKKFIQNAPLWFDVGARADVILGGEHKLVVQHPLGLVVQHGGRVQLHHLVVLHGQVMACALQMSNLLSQRGDKKWKNPTQRQLENEIQKLLGVY